jgi:hypothetical protein
VFGKHRHVDERVCTESASRCKSIARLHAIAPHNAVSSPVRSACLIFLAPAGAHQLDHRIAGAPHALRVQLSMRPRRPVRLAAGGVDFSDARSQHSLPLPEITTSKLL